MASGSEMQKELMTRGEYSLWTMSTERTSTVIYIGNFLWPFLPVEFNGINIAN